MEKFLEQISQTNLDFCELAFCFILDCSLFLGMNTKLINLMIILSILKVIEIINIKFSILLTADDNFKILLKNYDEDINFEDLIEVIYETCIIKRFRNNLAKSVEIAVKKIKCNKKSKVFIIFSDILDESVVYYNYWIKNILTDINNSFIFFVDKSSSLNFIKEQKSNTIKEMWSTFEKKVNEKAKSRIKIIDPYLNRKEMQIDENIIFKDISVFLNEVSAKPNSSKTELKNCNYNNKNKALEKNNIDYFKELSNDETYKKYEEIYFFNYHKKKLNYIADSEIKMQIYNYNEKNEIPEIKAYTRQLKQSFQDKILIESIFFPNKATQKQLSTKGTEIDIMSLILYTLRPVQEPMIYLEEKGGLIRDYSITIIIDNSKSSLSSFNEKHSYLTIINLFKIIYSMAIPSFDLIITGQNGEPSNILLFDKPSITIFKHDELFKNILTFLINPNFNTDLGEAIRSVYELKKN